MSLTNPQDLTARILNPRSKNGGIKSSSTGRSADFIAEAHLSNQETGPSKATSSQPIVSSTGFQNIPPPSALFRTTMASWRHNQQHHPSFVRNVSDVNENIPLQNNEQSMATLPRMTSVSKNKAKEHSRQLSQLARLRSTTSGALHKKTSQTSSTPSWRRNPLTRIIDSLKRSPDNVSDIPVTTDPDVVLEFDRDISEFLVSVSGTFLGMNPNELMQSTGLRQLIARNMRWFQNTPDWMKVIGLLVAKKFNGEVRNRNAFIENAISSFSPPSSSSFVSEGMNEEDSEVQPLLIRSTEPIPIPQAQEEIKQEDHIPFEKPEEVLFDKLFEIRRTSSSSSSDNKKSAKANQKKKNKSDESVKDKKRKSVDMDIDVEDEKVREVTKKVKPIQVRSRKLLAAPEATIDVLDVDEPVRDDSDFPYMQI